MYNSFSFEDVINEINKTTQKQKTGTVTKKRLVDVARENNLAALKVKRDAEIVKTKKTLEDGILTKSKNGDSSYVIVLNFSDEAITNEILEWLRSEGFSVGLSKGMQDKEYVIKW